MKYHAEQIYGILVQEEPRRKRSESAGTFKKKRGHFTSEHSLRGRVSELIAAVSCLALSSPCSLPHRAGDQFPIKEGIRAGQKSQSLFQTLTTAARNRTCFPLLFSVSI